MDDHSLTKSSRFQFTGHLKSLSLRKALLTPVCITFCSIVLSNDVDAQDITSTEHGDVFVITFKEFVERKSNGIACGELPRVIKYKAFQSQDNQNFTEAEYQSIAGDALYLGLRDPNFWYSKAKRKLVSADELFEMYGSWSSGNWNHLPMLCGAETVRPDTPKSNTNTITGWKNGESSCSGEFCDLSGGAYFHAVYENDIELLKRLDRSIDNTVKRKLGAILSLSQDLGQNPQDFSLLPALANAYLARRSKRISTACEAGLVRKVVTRKTATYDMFDAEGLYEGQGGGEVYRFTYWVSPAMVPLCDSVCDARGGTPERSAVRSLGHRGANSTLDGIDELVSKYSCSSREIAQFEKNLAAMTKHYLAQKYQWIEARAVDARDTQGSLPAGVTDREAESATSREEGSHRTPSVEQARSAAPATAGSGNAARQGNAPAAVVPASTPVPVATGPVQRQQGMNAELAAAGQKYQQEMAQLNEAMQRAIRSAGTAAARTEAMTEYQEKLADIQRRAQEETQRIRERY